MLQFTTFFKFCHSDPMKQELCSLHPYKEQNQCIERWSCWPKPVFKKLRLKYRQVCLAPISGLQTTILNCFLIFLDHQTCYIQTVYKLLLEKYLFCDLWHAILQCKEYFITLLIRKGLTNYVSPLRLSHLIIKIKEPIHTAEMGGSFLLCVLADLRT